MPDASACRRPPPTLLRPGDILQRRATQPAALYLSAPDIVGLVQLVVLPQGLAYAVIAGRLAAVCRRWPEFYKCACVACRSDVCVVGLMPIAGRARFAFVYVNGVLGFTRLGVPRVLAFGVVAGVATGAPVLLSELTLTCAIRSAAMSALAARHLARPGSRPVALIGHGAPSEFPALSFRDLVGIRGLGLFDVDPAATGQLVGNLAGQGL